MPYSKKQLDQLSKPHGEDGLAILERLNRVNTNINRAALDALGGDVGQSILEIGFGGGALIADGLKRLPLSKFYGAEISELAIERCTQEFTKEIGASKVSLHQFDGQHLPFGDATFDRVVAVNVIYFVADIALFISEVLRVLKTGGWCVLGYAEGSPDQITRFEKQDIESVLLKAGFARSTSRSYKDRENGVFYCTVGFT